MRSFPDLNAKYDLKDLERLKAKEWQLDLLKKNPDYPHWGNYEDYMSGKDKGWASPVELESFKEKFDLDDYNELVHFYFEVYRKNHECPHCEGDNQNPATKKLSDDWYSFDKTDYVSIGEGRRYNNAAWQYHLTDIEVEALVKDGRLTDLMPGRKWYRFEEETQKWMVMDDSDRNNRHWVECEKPEFPSAQEVNEWSSGTGKYFGKRGMGHDAINKWVCVKARAKHLGIYGHCEHCEGGFIYDEPEARVALQLWILHPRKGASRGVYIKNIEENEVPEVIQYLKIAAERNSNRFSKL